MIVENYLINKQTLALIPAKQIDYDTIAIEKDRTKHVRKTALKIIQQSCLHHGYTYKGRRDAVIHHTNFKRKTPIPIDRYNTIYLFPTHSIQSIDNHWITHHHISHITPSATNKTIIHFKNGHTLLINTSKYILQHQIERTFACKWIMENMKVV